MRGAARNPIALVVLAVMFFVLALAASWAQDVAAPWINLGEARMGSPVAFDSDGGKYRVITSGPTRPRLRNTACRIVRDGAGTQNLLGGRGGVSPHERLGVSRVLEFRVPAGRTEVTCNDRNFTSSPLGRFQIVAGDGPVSIGIIVAFVLAGLSLAGGLLMLVLQMRRRPAG